MRESKNVFFLISKLDGGGVTSICIDLAKELKKLGREIIFVYGIKTGPHFKDEIWIAKQGFKVYKTGFKEGSPFSPPNLLAYARYIKLLFKHKPGIIHCHSRSMTLFAFISKLLNTKNILTIHLHFFPKGRILNILLKTFDAYIAISSEIEEGLRQSNLNNKKIYKICNGVDDTIFYPRQKESKEKLKSKYGFNHSKLLLLTVARLEKGKAIPVLLEALAELDKNARRKVNCIIVGDGTQMNYLLELKKQHQLEDTIFFMGYKPPQDFYAFCDVFILPSMSEGFAVTVVEAMLSGLAIIKTPTSGTRDQVIEGKNGLIFPFGDRKSLANHIKYLLENPGELKSMQEESYKLAKAKLTLKAVAEQTIQIYNK